MGIPSVAIMTTKFASAAELMARVLGADGDPGVTIEHPISSATSDVLSERARRAVCDAVSIVVGSAAR